MGEIHLQDIEHCKKCSVELSDLNWQPGLKKANKKWCAACSNKRSTLWKKENKDKVKAQRNEWNKQNPEKVKSYRKKVEPEQIRQYIIKREYNLSWEEYQKLYVEFKGLCGICAKPLSLIKTNSEHTAHIDHDHLTGKVRGILCRSCNRGIGYLNDSPERLQKAATYLETYGDRR